MGEYLKHTFTSGRMNKDLDDRLIPNGEYTDALNVQVSSSEGSDVGAIENLLGNEQVQDLELTNAKTIGAYSHPLNDKIYWFVTSDGIDGVYEFDEKSKVITPIIIDTKISAKLETEYVGLMSNEDGHLVLMQKSNSGNLSDVINSDLPENLYDEVLIRNNFVLKVKSQNISISVPKNTVLRNIGLNKYLVKNIKYDGKRFDNPNALFNYTVGGILNFSKDHLITGVNVIDDLLFWTDNLNQPRRISLSQFKRATNNDFRSETILSFKVKTEDGIVTEERPFSEDDISVIKKSPMRSPKLSIVDTNLEGIIDIQYSYNLHSLTPGESFVIENLSQMPSWKVGDIIVASSDDTELTADLKVKNIGNFLKKKKSVLGYSYTNYKNSVELEITIKDDGDSDSGEKIYDFIVKQDDPIYELAYTRFAYRWKYKNGEYSTFSPFTVPAFIPGNFKYDGREAFNHAMVNNVRKVSLSEFDLGPDDVEEIDILFKETRNNNIYTLKTAKKIDFNGLFDITKEQIHAVVENEQLLRQWDNVPRRAKSQEITANRVIYGNYVQNYDVDNEPSLNVGVSVRPNQYKRTIKSNRNYQLGVVYIDEYNRQTPVLSNDTGSLFVSKANSVANNKIDVAIDSPPPAWASYFKYFIKETSAEYYNLAADRFYKEPDSGFVYVSFPSTERNKITEDSYLLLKKYHGSDEAIIDTDNRYKVIDITAEPPEFVQTRYVIKNTMANVIFGPAYGSGSAQATKKAGSTPFPAQRRILVTTANDQSTIDSLDGNRVGVNEEDRKFLNAGNYIAFHSEEYKFTKKYKIRSVRYHLEGKAEAEIVFDDPFEDDVNILYKEPNNEFSELVGGIEMRIYEDEANAGDPEFQGRFFVKLKGNALLTQAIEQEEEENTDNNNIKYYPESVASFDGIDRNPRDFWKNVGPSGQRLADTPVHVWQGGLSTNGSGYGTGKRYSEGNKEFHISFKQTGPNDDTAFLDNIRVGRYMKFSNNEKVYRIAHVKKGKKKGPRDNSQRVAFTHVLFADEEGREQNIHDICAPGKNLEPDKFISATILIEKPDDKVLFTSNPAIFETEPIDSKTELNLYFEASDAYDISQHGETQSLEWYNAFAFGNGVESNRIRDDFNAVFLDNGVKASTTLAEPVKEEHRFNGIIWSGIFNSRSGVNRTNQFNVANPITKDLLPSYGSIQKFHAWDDSMVVLCEDKVLRVLANKSALYNADGSSNLISDARVLGDPIEYSGDYGIATNPETFASYGFRCYFADRMRGVVLRLSKDGLTPISSANMNDFFRDRLFNSTLIGGSYDNRNKLYNITFDNLDTVCFAENVNGWITRKSFIPEYGISLNDRYYTYQDGNIWLHDVETVDRNLFYGTQYKTNVEFTINDNPSTIKKFLTLAYEGSKDWVVTKIKTDQAIGRKTTFTPKENVYFANIGQEEKRLSNLDQKNFSTQGIGRSIRKPGEDDYVDQLPPQETESFTVTTDLSGPGDTTANFSADDVTVNILPGNDVGNVVITLNVDDGFELTPSDVDITGVVINDDDISFSDTEDDINDYVIIGTDDDGNVTITITDDFFEDGVLEDPVNFPLDDDVLTISVTGDPVRIQRSISGNYTINKGHFYTTVGDGEFFLTGTPGSTELIKTRIVTPQEGYYITLADITQNNPNIIFEVVKSSIVESVVNGQDRIRWTLNESVVVPTNNTTDVDYDITVKTNAIEIPPPLVLAKSINQALLDNDGETRTLRTTGEPNAEVIITFSDTSGLIDTYEHKFDSTGLLETSLSFEEGTTEETYTIKYAVKEGTEFSSNFGDKTITLKRPEKKRRNLVVSTILDDEVIDTYTTAVFDDEVITQSVTVTGTLDGTGYTLDPVLFGDPIKWNFGDDATTSSTINDTEITITDITLTTAADDTFSYTYEITSDGLDEPEVIIIEIDTWFRKEITLSFTYSNTKAAGGAISYVDSFADYHPDISALPYTITCDSGIEHTPDVNEYHIALDVTDGYKMKSSITEDDFALYDSSNNDVTSTFCHNDRIKLNILDQNGDYKILVGFRTKKFTAPTSNQTYTIRPKSEIFEVNNDVAMSGILIVLLDLNPVGFTKPNGSRLVDRDSLTSDNVNYQLENRRSFYDDFRTIQADQFNKTLTPPDSWGEDNYNYMVNYSGQKQLIEQFKVWPYSEYTDESKTSLADGFTRNGIGRLVYQNAANIDRLWQLHFPIADELFYWWDTNTSDNNKWNFVDADGNITEASAGTYTDIHGDSKTVTGPYEISDDDKMLTVNLIINFGGTAPSEYVLYSKLTISIKNEYEGYFDKYKIRRPDTLEPNCSLVFKDGIPFETYYSDDNELNLGSYLFKRDSKGNMYNDFAGSNRGYYVENHQNLIEFLGGSSATTEEHQPPEWNALAGANSNSSSILLQKLSYINEIYDTNCALNLGDVKVTITDIKYPSGQQPKVYYNIPIPNTQFKITGTIVKNIPMGSVPRNDFGSKPQRLRLVATDGSNVPASDRFPNGVEGMEVIKQWWAQKQLIASGGASEDTVSELMPVPNDITNYAIILTSDTTWEAILETDENGNGFFRPGFIPYRNMCITAVQFNSTQFDFSKLSKSHLAWAYMNKDVPGVQCHNQAAPWWSPNKQWPDYLQNDLLDITDPDGDTSSFGPDSYYSTYYNTDDN
jgi:hypothetical protein